MNEFSLRTRRPVTAGICYKVSNMAIFFLLRIRPFDLFLSTLASETKNSKENW
jgi:hypothetical protein